MNSLMYVSLILFILFHKSHAPGFVGIRGVTWTFEDKMVISHQTEDHIEIPSERMRPELSNGEILKFRNFRCYLRELTKLT